MAIVGVLGVGSLDRRRNQNYRKATLKPDSCTDPILKCASEGGRRRAVIQMSDTNTEQNTVSLYPNLLVRLCCSTLRTLILVAVNKYVNSPLLSLEPVCGGGVTTGPAQYGNVVWCGDLKLCF